MHYFNAKSEIHHPYAAKRLFRFGCHGAKGFRNRSKRGLGIEFVLKNQSESFDYLDHCNDVFEC